MDTQALKDFTIDGPHRGEWWTELAEPPEIPGTLPSITAKGPASVRWLHSMKPGYDLYGAIGGDSGAEGAYVIAVYVMPVPKAKGSAPVPNRFPTFEEWASLCQQECLPGVVFSCSLITGSKLIEPEAGRCLLVAQTSTLAGTPADRRWRLAHPGTMLGGAHG